MSLSSLREVKKERCRRAIIDAGMQLFHARGFNDVDVTVADIAAAAEVSPRTLHRSFTSKDEIVYAEGAGGKRDRHVREPRAAVPQLYARDT